jgi:Na+/melibiose symporter-like transporter
MADRLNKSLLYTYGIADLFFGLMVSMEAYFFAAFLTDYAQFPLILSGQILWITSLMDILCVFAGGFILQRMVLRFGGKYRSWFLIGPPLIAPLFILQFTKFGGELTAAGIIIIGFTASHLLFNVVVAAGGAMVGRLSQRNDERTILSASRAQGIAASGLLFSVSGLTMITYFGAQTGKVTGFAIAVGVYSVLMILGYWYIYMITTGKDPYDEVAAGPSGVQPGQSMAEVIRLAVRNPPLMLLLVAETFRNASIFVISAFAFYYFEYVQKDVTFVSLFILSFSVAGLAGALAAAWIGVRIGKRNTYCIFALLAAAGFASAIFLGETSWSFAVIVSIGGVFGAVPGAMGTALLSDTVVYGEWKSGRNIRAFAMSLGNLPIKLSVLIRSAVLSVGLMAIGFVANTVPTQRVMDGITWLITIVPAALSLLAAAVFYFGYRVEDEQVLEMQEEIEARKSAALAGP